MKTHTFGSTEHAYGACQGDDIKNGDILDIEAEGVVGLAWAWPVAVTAESGELDAVRLNPGAVERVAEKAGWSNEQISAAVALATSRGYEIAEPFQGYVASAPSP